MRNCEKTCLKKYGVKNPFSIPEVKDKIKSLNLIKYGVEFNSQNNEIKNKMISSKLINTYNRICEKYKGIYEPAFDVSEFKGIRHYYNFKCCKCGKIFKSMYNNGSIISRCFDCYPRKKYSTSLPEKEIYNILNESNINIKLNDRDLIYPQELDIVIPDKKIAIEFDGTYWHSTSNNKDSNYHLNKTEMCEKIGYKLIHIFEYEWDYKKDLIKNKIKAIIGLSQEIIGARKCIIKNVDTKEKNEFLEKHHIQGKDSSSIKLGLYYNNELVAIMTFGKPRFNKNYEYELIRYATKSGYRVVGGAGKLLKYFERNYKPSSIISYADRRWSIGNLYKKLNFSLVRKAGPNYVWIRGSEIYPRYQTQKSKLRELLGNENFDENMSEFENMKKNNFLQLFDCGNLVFEKVYNQ